MLCWTGDNDRVEPQGKHNDDGKTENSPFLVMIDSCLLALARIMIRIFL